MMFRAFNEILVLQMISKTYCRSNENHMKRCVELSVYFGFVDIPHAE